MIRPRMPENDIPTMAEGEDRFFQCPRRSCSCSAADVSSELTKKKLGFVEVELINIDAASKCHVLLYKVYCGLSCTLRTSLFVVAIT